MIENTISPRYAKVLFDLDCQKNILEQRLADFQTLLQILQDYPKLTRVLNSPQIALHDKKNLIQNTLSSRLDPIFLNFIFFLLQKEKFTNLHNIANAYKQLVNAHLGVWEADIVTAVAMDNDSENKLREKLEQHFHKKINLNKIVDPKIIGGAICVIGNEMLDWSVSGKLRKLKEKLIATQV